MSPIVIKENIRCIECSKINSDGRQESDSRGLKQPVPLFTTGEESFMNNCILGEVLGEKKRALLESASMLEFLKNHIQSS
ncbi:hypothetical protein R5R35_006849 [Gryllus longicercus]|uniref:Uncharacterized protein n=1 Tax=Gryllus longicercus TaxID=2509291 RepID=A0AAN9YZZ2_9ORTH